MSEPKPFRTCTDAVREFLPDLPPSLKERIVQLALSYEYVDLQEIVIRWCACARTAGTLDHFLRLPLLALGPEVARAYERDPSAAAAELDRALATGLQDLQEAARRSQEKLQRALADLYRAGYRDPRHGLP